MSTLRASADLTYGSEHLIFPSSGSQLLSAVSQLLGVSILAHCLSRRLAVEELFTLRGWKDLTWPRLCVLLVFLDSWLFLFTCGVLIFGIGLDHGDSACSLSIYLCIAFYGSSKLFIYCFLIEKVHVVWAPTSNTRRFLSPVYILCVITVSLYAVVAVIQFIGRVHYLRDDGSCVTGVNLYASVPLLSYDLYVNIFLTSMFLWPLVKTGRVDPLLRRIAQRTLIAATVALATSTANVLVLTLLHGKELGWVCLGSCGADVICNALGLFWVTERAKPRFSPDMEIGKTDTIGPTHGGCNTERRAMVPPNIVESFSSSGGLEEEESGYLDPRQEIICNTESPRKSVSTFRLRDTLRPSTVKSRANSRSGSTPSPWSMGTIVSLFLKGQEPHPDDLPLEVTITTQMEVADETIDLSAYSKTPRKKALKKPRPDLPQISEK